MTDILPSYIRDGWWAPAEDEDAAVVSDASTGEPVVRLSTRGLDLAAALDDPDAYHVTSYGGAGGFTVVRAVAPRAQHRAPLAL